MQLNLPDPREGCKPCPAADHVLAPYFGPVVRTDWRPTVPGPQPHNAGITPGYRRDGRSAPGPHLAKHIVDAVLAEALTRLAALAAAEGVACG
jgi:hypothetical protein